MTSVCDLLLYPRSVVTAAQQRRKAGRQVVSFLMVVNITLWVATIVHTSQLTAGQGDGDWRWLLLLHISLPLCILYRLVITVTNTVPVHDPCAGSSLQLSCTRYGASLTSPARPRRQWTTSNASIAIASLHSDHQP